jgi:hypothetical protein
MRPTPSDEDGDAAMQPPAKHISANHVAAERHRGPVVRVPVIALFGFS